MTDIIFRNAFTHRKHKGQVDTESYVGCEYIVDTNDYISISEYCVRFGLKPKPVNVVDDKDELPDDVDFAKDLGDFNYSKPSQEEIDLLNQELKKQDKEEKQERVDIVDKSQGEAIATNQQEQVASPSISSQ